MVTELVVGTDHGTVWLAANEERGDWSATAATNDAATSTAGRNLKLRNPGIVNS